MFCDPTNGTVSPGDIIRRIKLDQFHRIEDPALKEKIERQQTELASMRQARIIRATTESKARVIEALRDGRLARACSRLRKSLINGGTPVFEWLAEREKSQSGEASR